MSSEIKTFRVTVEVQMMSVKGPRGQQPMASMADRFVSKAIEQRVKDEGSLTAMGSVEVVEWTTLSAKEVVA